MSLWHHGPDNTSNTQRFLLNLHTRDNDQRLFAIGIIDGMVNWNNKEEEEEGSV